MTRRLSQMSWVCHPEHSRQAAACMPSMQKALVCANASSLHMPLVLKP